MEEILMTKFIFFFKESSQIGDFNPLWIRQDGARDVIILQEHLTYSLDDIYAIAFEGRKNYLAYKIYEGQSRFRCDPISTLIKFKLKEIDSSKNSLYYYVIRHKESKLFFPAKKNGKGQSNLEVSDFSPTVPPRLFTAKRFAGAALTHWLKGIASYDEEEFHMTYQQGKERRFRTDFEVLPIKLTYLNGDYL